MLKSEHINSKWINCIQKKKILDNSGRHDLWTHQPATINISISKMIKQNLIGQLLLIWLVSVEMYSIVALVYTVMLVVIFILFSPETPLERQIQTNQWFSESKATL